MYFLRRILTFIPLLLIITFTAFVLARSMPGSPFDKERAPASPEIERALKAKYHLDEPLMKQYLRYLGLGWERGADGNMKWFQGGLLRGDFGLSTKYRNHTVNDIIKQALPVSLTLGALAFLFAQGVGIPLGFYTAVKRGQWGDHLGSFFALLAFCIPGLVIGPMLIVVFAIKWRLFPAGLWESPLHAILPSIALGLYFSGRVSRLMREGMTTVLHEGFITTARAKGLSEAQVLFKHGFRLAVLPVVSYSGPLLADMLTGSFVVETIFRVPGIGPFLVNSLQNRDALMVVGLVLLYAILLLALNLLVDLSYSLLDKRVRYE
jgi:ABC-type dipeptide/oligopeptide/nickel transport system permease component